jgi:hypothetical protein
MTTGYKLNYKTCFIKSILINISLFNIIINISDDTVFCGKIALILISTISIVRVGQVIKCLILKKTEPKGKGSTLYKAKPKVLLALAIGKQDAEQIRLLISATLPAVEEVEQPLALTNATEESDKEKVASDDKASIDPVDPSSTQKEGEFVSGVIYKIETDTLSVRLSDGRLGQLHKHQCVDFAANSDAYFLSSTGSNGKKKGAFYSIGTKVVNALVLSVSKKILNLTLKPLLLASAKVKLCVYWLLLMILIWI